ncbi:unnamed protein product [Kuraishia capsulata CBS 1993]|uniref:GTP-binding protein rhb1 n=1 Tax=Kuraishia capsulata CBS 1993 TaxID=1382522 RepID=W6MHH4_9ASCO|nr:uncharacterized protein KUCA_T00001684001 [Kuraishia capsulata CBS 1993]CDK25714.1 unnamed protein product [Kuraishia capsulata CBS 1993]
MAYSSVSRERKVAVVGARAVGKSSLTVQFVEEHFNESYYPTIENQLGKTVNYKGFEYSIEILDTAGQDEFSMMNQKHLIGIHGYVLVYSITSRSSFDMLKIIRDKILDSTGQDQIPMVIVGNKSDLNLQRQVSQQDLKDLAQEFGGCPYIECSAKQNEKVSRAFEIIVGAIEEQQNPTADQEVQEGSSCVII